MPKKISLPLIIEDPRCVPEYASLAAAGADLKAFISEPMNLLPGQSFLVPTGIKMEIPEGYEVQIRPRSGLALKNQITVLNTPGTIDSDYRGEVKVLLINHGSSTFVIQPFMRIAQMVLAPVEKAEFVLAEALSSSERGAGGFGFTGVM